MHAQDADLQARMVLEPAPALIPALATPTASAPTTTTERERAPRRPAIKPGVYDLLIESAAHVGVLLAAVGLWWIGASFTLGFLADVGAPMAKLSAAQWGVPLLISAIEIKLLPKIRESRHLLVIFGIVAGFDLLTSTAGGVTWGAGRTIPRINVTLPASTSGWLWFGSLVIAAACAFWAEPLARQAVRDLRKLWKI